MQNWYKKISQNNQLLNDLIRILVTWLKQTNNGYVDVNSVYQDIDVLIPGIDDSQIISNALFQASAIVSGENSMGMLSENQNILFNEIKNRFSTGN